MFTWMKHCLAIILLLAFTACVPHQYPSSSNSPPVIGPYHDFSARLLVMEPKHRWQVMLRWVGDEKSGYARLTHGASGRVLQILWEGKRTTLLDNQQSPPQWKKVSQQELIQQGFIVSPSVLAGILHNHIPKALHYKRNGRWQGSGTWQGITMRWQPKRQNLRLTHIAKGREVRLIIIKKYLKKYPASIRLPRSL